MQRVALATCRHHPGFIAGDDEALIPHLHAAGFETARPRWDDPEVDWSAFDAVLLRTTWDYTDRHEEFLAWCRRVDGLSRLLNPLPVVERNCSKTYLRQLADRGVPTVPTAWIDAPSDVARVLACASGGGVLKPSIGAGASGMLVFDRPDEAAARHAESLLGLGPALCQPLLRRIATEGETSLVYFADGQGGTALSHAVRKTPKHGEVRVQIEFGGMYTPVEPTAAQRSVAEAALETVKEPLLYARLDLVPLDDGSPAVIEMELIEPELFFPFVAASGRSFAGALNSMLGAQSPR